MTSRKFLVLTSVVLALAVLAWGVGPGWAQPPDVTNKVTAKKALDAEKKAAAARAKALGLSPGVSLMGVPGDTPLGGIEGPGGIPHYFGPYGNWAFSPLPKGPVTAVTVTSGGTGYTSPTCTISDAHGTNDNVTLPCNANLSGVVEIPAGGPYGAGFTAPIVIITDPTGTGATAEASIAMVPIGADYPAGIGIKKFVDNVALLGPGGANTLGQYIPVAVADNTSYLGSDYYEIALVEYAERMHSNLPPTRLRGYVQLWTQALFDAGKVGQAVSINVNGTNVNVVDNPHYLGPIIVAQGRAHGVAGPAGEPRPVRIKFYNLLPTGLPDPITGIRPGDLFLPTDESIMGAGYGPALPGTAGEKFTQNRATIHLHGNNTVWISDGNVHQWITPANEDTNYPSGVSARNVPDMKESNGNIVCDADPVNAPGLPGSSGCMTFFYTNAQSARLQFYHDHAMGITRLNVYAGEAAGYVLTDAVDQDMINGTNVSGVNIPKDVGIPCPPGGRCARNLCEGPP